MDTSFADSWPIFAIIAAVLGVIVGLIQWLKKPSNEDCRTVDTVQFFLTGLALKVFVLFVIALCLQRHLAAKA